jgi:hypothetical protein
VGDPIDGGDANRRAVEFSPIATIDQWHSPVLLVQADDDDVVPSQQTAELMSRGRTTAILAAFVESSGSLSWLTVHRT